MKKQKDRCVKHWTCDCRRGGRNDKYAACYESDFSVFREAYASANNVAVSGVYTFILSIIGINGVPEAIVAGVLTLCIGRALLKKNVRERLGFRNDIGY